MSFEVQECSCTTTGEEACTEEDLTYCIQKTTGDAACTEKDLTSCIQVRTDNTVSSWQVLDQNRAMSRR